jgi:hypothetical protein
MSWAKPPQGQHVGIPVQSIPSNINIIIDPGSPGPCFPFIFQGPQSTVGYLGYRASFNVSAGPGTGCAPLTYTWRRGCTILANGGSISGANTSTLVIDPVSAADAGPYEVSVNSYAIPTATLSVTCYSNCDASTVSPLLNVNDFTCFQNHFAAGASSANCDLSTAPPLLTSTTSFVSSTNTPQAAANGSPPGRVVLCRRCRRGFIREPWCHLTPLPPPADTN